MKNYASTFRSFLDTAMPAVPGQTVLPRLTLPLRDARNVQRAVAKETRAEHAKDNQDVADLDLE